MMMRLFGKLGSKAGTASGTVRLDWLLGMLIILVVGGLFCWMVADPGSLFMEFLKQTNLMLLAPELIVVIVILASVLHLSFARNAEERRDTWWLATSGTFLALVCLLLHFSFAYAPKLPADQLGGGPQYILNQMVYSYGQLFASGYGNGQWTGFSVYNGMFSADLFSLIVRVLLTFGTLLTLMFSRRFIDTRADVPGEFYPLLMSALLGGMMLSGSTDLIMLFVSLETLSISSYILVGYLRGNVRSTEAGLKYLLYGGVATACLLFGFSLLYGLSGNTGFAQIAANLPNMGTASPLVLSIMVIMMLGGVAFKLSAAPFHMWTPDAYEGAPTSVTAFLGVVSKIAAFALAIRLFYVLFGQFEGWFALLSVLAVVSMTVGNVVALTQRNIKRLLAYSTVAHVGYLLLGLVIMSQDAVASLLYYLATYLFMNLGAFAVVTHFENLTGSEAIEDYAGLVRKRPALALIFTVMLLSLSGLPITAGFFGKFFLFQAVATAGSQYLWLVVVALITSTVSLYYYLNVVRLMVIAEPSTVVAALPEESAARGAFGLTAVDAVLMLCLFGTLALGLYAQPFLALSREAVAQLRVQQPVTYSLKAPALSQARR